MELNRAQKREAKRKIEKKPTLIADLFAEHDRKEAFRKSQEIEEFKSSKVRKLAIGVICLTVILIVMFVWL